uniref:Thioredoxin-like protein n=1 Tax=Nannochloris bacillaris TaxID=76111 RepID=Q68BL1_NANBA|nr:thioredoxin-like protein [Nannochloris bacillaris]
MAQSFRISSMRCSVSGVHQPAFSGAQTVRTSVKKQPLLNVSPARRLQTQRSVPAHAEAETAPAPATEGWWTVDLPANFVHVESVQELVDELGEGARLDQLVVVDFFAPWCRACKALFPKFKKLCIENPNVRFVGINFEENKGLARSLGVKVLPFFHFYRGAEGRVGAFSASVSKVQLLRDAIADFSSERCFLEEVPEAPLPEFPSILPGGSLGGKNVAIPSGKDAELVA